VLVSDETRASITLALLHRQRTAGHTGGNVEIDEVAARLVRQYWALLVAGILLPLVVVTLTVARQPDVYAADARIITSSEIPVAASQADAIVSQVQGIATGPTSASQALRKAGVRVNLADFLAKNVSVTGLGTSQVVDVVVSDLNPVIAQKAAGVLAAEVVTALNRVSQGGLSAALTVTDADIVRLTENRSAVAAQLSADPQNQQLQAKLAGLDQVIANFTGDRSRLLIQASTQGLAAIIDQPRLPQAPQSKALAQKLGLAALLGLVLGILLAAVAETIRPTVPGVRRVSRRLSAPMLGSLTDEDLRGKCTPNFDNLALLLRLAATHAGVPKVALVDVGGERQLGELAELLTHAMPAPSPARAGTAAANGSDTGNRPGRATAGHPESGGTTLMMERAPTVNECAFGVYSLEQLQRQAETGLAGIVVLAGPVARVSRVSAMDDLAVSAGWPIIGVVGVPGQRRRWWRVRTVSQHKTDGVVRSGVAEAFPETRAE
jgi:capsular polysaccharide biosynthesis protein